MFLWLFQPRSQTPFWLSLSRASAPNAASINDEFRAATRGPSPLARLGTRHLQPIPSLSLRRRRPQALWGAGARPDPPVTGPNVITSVRAAVLFQKLMMASIFHEFDLLFSAFVQLVFSHFRYLRLLADFLLYLHTVTLDWFSQVWDLRRKLYSATRDLSR